MTIAFTSIIAIFIIERIDERKGTISIIPLLLAGVISILYWRQELYLIPFYYDGYFFPKLYLDCRGTWASSIVGNEVYLLEHD